MSNQPPQHYIVHLDVEATALDFSSVLALSDTVRAAIGPLNLGSCTTSIEVLDGGARVRRLHVPRPDQTRRLVARRSRRVEDARYRGEFLG